MGSGENKRPELLERAGERMQKPHRTDRGTLSWAGKLPWQPEEEAELELDFTEQRPKTPAFRYKITNNACGPHSAVCTGNQGRIRQGATKIGLGRVPVVHR